MVKQIITDEELTLKRQARRRLIGAIALTIMVVILLPMVLDTAPPAPTQDIELQIPDKDKAGEFVPKMVLPTLSAASAVPQTAASAPVIAPLLDAKPASAVAQTKVETPPLVDMQPKVEQPIKPTESKPKVEAKAVSGKPASKPVSKPHSGFVLQVGAFANADTAKKLQEKLHKQGYPSYTEKAADKTRVRVGDYTTHAEAEKVQRKLEIQGMKPDVIKLN